MKLLQIIESNIQEALNLTVAKNYAEYIRRPETEKVVDDIMAKLKQQGTFTGKESKRGERIYFDYDNSDGEKPEKFRSPTMDGIELTLQNYADVFKELFGKTYSLEGGKDYLDNLVTDSKGQKVGIGKLFNNSIEKLKKKGDEESLKIAQRFEYNRRAFQEDQARNNAISRKNKKTYIVISKANYDIASMSTGRGWEDSSCMKLTSGQGITFVHCDIKEGTLIAYLIDGDDINIKRPIARVLIKPFISLDKYKDYLYVVGDTYGTAPGFSEVVKKMFKEAQPDKAGTYRINKKLYPDSLPRDVRIEKKVKVINKEMFDKYVEQEGSRIVSVDARSFGEFFNISPESIEILSGIEADTTIYISGEWEYSSDFNNLSRVSEISDVKTEDSLHVKELSGLTKISNVNSKYIYIEKCENLETVENISIQGSINFDSVSSTNLKRISGNTDRIRIDFADQRLVDRLDINDLKIENYLTIESFTGTSLEFLKNFNTESTIFVDECNNLEELPTRIGNNEYSYVALFLPKNMEGKVKVPENINYRVRFRDS